jgi:S1-C subfamily serine protease
MTYAACMAIVPTELLPIALLPLHNKAQFSLIEARATGHCQAHNSAILLTIRHLSVRLLGSNTSGSGVIVHQEGQIYTVLTNAHVVSSGSQYSVLTADGQTYEGWRLSEPRSEENDLALVQFRSDRPYSTAQFRNSNLTRGEIVYAAGFPSWYLLNSTHLVDTREEGFQAFRLTLGQVEMILSQPLQQGYQLGYTNNVTPGMSGGPILDGAGRLVGVNGGLSFPPQGRAAFTFADGVLPPDALFQQMQSLSWAIPISTIRQFFDPSLLPPI